jgi:pyruvate dehydrogenase E1 component alpha subunit
VTETVRATTTPARDRQHRSELLRTMLLIRRFEERCVELYSAQHIRGFLHLYIGEEAIATAVMAALGPADAVVSTYREHGHALARGVTPQAVMAEMYGKVTGCSRGRGGSMHLFDAATRFYGGNAIVGGGLPLAVGLGLADKMSERPRATVCLFGDGAVAEGEFHESMNLATLWRLPVLFCCENNLYAMGTRIDRAQAVTDLTARAAAYGLPASTVDGMDVETVLDAATTAAQRCRDGEGPQFLELQTYRFRAHSMYDPDRYRDKEEIAEWKKRDPVELFMDRLRAEGDLGDAEVSTMEKDVAAEIEAAVQAAEAAGVEDVGQLTRFVYSEVVT